VGTDGQDDGTGWGRKTVNGQQAVMAVNDKLLAALAALNPGQTLAAVQQSVPLEFTFSTANLKGVLYEFGQPKVGHLSGACDLGHQAVSRQPASPPVAAEKV